jgi:hypothetical protein
MEHPQSIRSQLNGATGAQPISGSKRAGHDKRSASERRRHGGERVGKPPVQQRAQDITRALAPFLIPMIQGLGELGAEDLDVSDLAGQVG